MQALEWEKSQGGGGGGDGDSVADNDKDNNVETAARDVSSVAGGAPSPKAVPESVARGGGLGEAAAGSSPEASMAAAGAGMETGGTAPAGAPQMGGSGESDNGGDDYDEDSDASQLEVEEVEGNEASQRLAAVELSSPAVVRRVAEKLKGYRVPPDRVEELRETLKGFLGTKNYHNYTNHKQAADPSCKRYVRACRETRALLR